jgi:hypothetical protein
LRSMRTFERVEREDDSAFERVGKHPCSRLVDSCD